MVYLNEAALLTDFPALEPWWRRHGHAGLAAWLLAHAAVISEAQLLPNPVNTPIEAGARVPAWRPPRYGRALVIDVAEVYDALPDAARGDLPRAPEGLLDIKGAGVAPGRRPDHALHSDGLLFLGEALQELSMQTLIEAALDYAESPHAAVPCYAVLDLGFDAVLRDGTRLPAGCQVRRAHRRELHGVELPDLGSAHQRELLKVESLLRHFGLTSADGALVELRADPRGGVRVMRGQGALRYLDPAEVARVLTPLGLGPPLQADGLNVQAARREGPGLDLVDFGQYRAQRRFERPVLSLVRDREIQWGGLLRPEHPAFVQPRPELALDPAWWSDEALGPEEQARFGGQARRSRQELSSFSVADALRAGGLDPAEALDLLAEPIRRAVERWPRSATSR